MLVVLMHKVTEIWSE